MRNAIYDTKNYEVAPGNVRCIQDFWSTYGWLCLQDVLFQHIILTLYTYSVVGNVQHAQLFNGTSSVLLLKTFLMCGLSNRIWDKESTALLRYHHAQKCSGLASCGFKVYCNKWEQDMSRRSKVTGHLHRISSIGNIVLWTLSVLVTVRRGRHPELSLKIDQLCCRLCQILACVQTCSGNKSCVAARTWTCGPL